MGSAQLGFITLFLAVMEPQGTTQAMHFKIPEGISKRSEKALEYCGGMGSMVPTTGDFVVVTAFRCITNYPSKFQC